MKTQIPVDILPLALTARAFSIYFSTVGGLPNLAANSAEDKYTLAPFPNRFGKLRVDVEITVVPSPIRAWSPMHSEYPGISMRAPALPKML